MQTLRPALVLVLLFTLLTGAVFPLAFVGLGQVVFPDQASGSLIRRDGQVVGSALIGQDFTDPDYFRPRPSATTPTPYAADSSGASNLGPTSRALITRVRHAVAAFGAPPVPADAVTTSGSGLDPDVSPANAAMQVARVAAARRVPRAAVSALLASHTRGRLFGFIGEPHVNVLRLNLALDQDFPVRRE